MRCTRGSKVAGASCAENSFHNKLPIIDAYIDIRYIYSCPSDHWLTAFLHPRVHPHRCDQTLQRCNAWLYKRLFFL